MRRVSTLFALWLGLAWFAHATIQVNWVAIGEMSSPRTGGPVNQGLALLIWTPTNAMPFDPANPTNLAPGEVLLDTTTTTNGYIIHGGEVYDATEPRYGLPEDFFVNGYVYARVFDRFDPDNGPYTYEQGGMVGPMIDRDPPSIMPPETCDLTGVLPLVFRYPPIDSDGDGLTDDVDPDDDNDGSSDVDEAVAGTDPLDPTDVLRINIALGSTNEVKVVFFPTKTLRFYELDRTTNLIDGPWANIATNIAGDGFDAQFFETNLFPNAAYRVRVRD